MTARGTYADWMSALRSLPRTRWTAERFGLTPRKLVARIGGSELPKIICVSLPKAGTHLIERALCLHPTLHRKILPTVTPENIGRLGGFGGLIQKLHPGQIVVSHLPFDPSYPGILDRSGARALFVVRDPRDIVVSIAHYITSREDHPLHSTFDEREDMRARIALAISGDMEARPPAPSIEQLLGLFSGWLRDGALVVRFEDLVGERGGGRDDAQAQALATVYSYLGIEVTESFLESACKRLFSSDSPTFRRGTVGQWREYFDPELEALCDRAVRGWIGEYGYSGG